MAFNDGAADGEPHAHPGSLGRIERAEDFLQALWVDANAGVAHRKMDFVGTLSGGCDQQIARPIVDFSHRVGSIQDQVEENLLKLHTIALDPGKLSSRSVRNVTCPRWSSQ